MNRDIFLRLTSPLVTDEAITFIRTSFCFGIGRSNSTKFRTSGEPDFVQTIAFIAL
jgi:hypothetical protein